VPTGNGPDARRQHGSGPEGDRERRFYRYCQKFYENQRGTYETTEGTEECSVFSTDLIIRTFLKPVRMQKLKKYSSKRAQRGRPVKSLYHGEI
jgi:hypothetical protein